MRKFFRISTVLAIVFMLACGVAACGGNAGDSTASETTGGSGEQTEAATTADTAPVSTAAPETAAVVETLPKADTKTNVDAMLGKWVDVNDANSTAEITKTDSGYLYADADGKYTATFENGVLKVKASDTDNAEVYIDPDTGHLLVSYKDGVTEYLKK